jgi:hypothetical protein
VNMAPRGKDPLFTPRDESSPPPQGAQWWNNWEQF